MEQGVDRAPGLLTTRWVAGAVLGASAGALTVAFLSQYVGGLEPCTLCIYQRYPYGVAISLAFLALGVGGRLAVAAIALAAVVFAVDAGIAFYHVGVEQGWFAGLAACGGQAGTPASLADLKAQLLATPPGPRCDEVPWSLFGVSMAGYNMLYAAALAVATFAAVVALARRGAT